LIKSQFAEWFGLSTELGCFVAGAVLVTDDHELIKKVEAIKDLFACLFFATIGIHVFPNFLYQQAPLLLAMTGAVMCFKALFTFLLLHYGLRCGPWSSWAVGMGLSQISEFTFVLASKAVAMRILSKEMYYLLVAVTTLSLLLTPLIWSTVRWMLLSKQQQEYWFSGDKFRGAGKQRTREKSLLTNPQLPLFHQSNAGPSLIASNKNFNNTIIRTDVNDGTSKDVLTPDLQTPQSSPSKKQSAVDWSFRDEDLLQWRLANGNFTRRPAGLFSAKQVTVVR
jgi:hypothetical protein